jgi:hypothetical protein
MAVLPDRSKDQFGNPIAGAVKAPATNLALGGITLAGLTTVAASWQGLFKTIFGTSATEATRKDVLIASMIALAIIVTADLFARAITAAAAERCKCVTDAASSWAVLPAPAGLNATVHQAGFQVAALRSKPAAPEEIQYLVVKAGRPPSWKNGNELDFG